MKRSKVFVAIVLAICLISLMMLVACDIGNGDIVVPDKGDNDKPSTDGKVPPVYKGMTVSLDTTSAVALADENSNTTITADAEALVGESVLITVHFENKDQFEILSFMLNDKKYAIQQFLPGSTIEDLIVRVNVGDVVGMQRHVISAIKFIDGELIKDVKLDGKTYVDIDVVKTFEGLTLEDETIEYDGKEHSLEVKGLPEGATVVYTGNGVSEVGEHEVTATISKKGNRTCVLKATLTILPLEFANITMDDLVILYDGKEHSLEVNGLPEGATVVYTGNGVSEVGEHEVTATISKTGYKDIVLKGVIKIASYVNNTLDTNNVFTNHFDVKAKNIDFGNGALILDINDFKVDIERRMDANGNIKMKIKYYNIDASFRDTKIDIFHILKLYLFTIPSFNFDATMLSTVKNLVFETELTISKTEIKTDVFTIRNIDKLKDANGKNFIGAKDGDGNLIGSVYQPSEEQNKVDLSNEAVFNALTKPDIDILGAFEARYDMIKNQNIEGTQLPCTPEIIFNAIFGRNNLTDIKNDIIKTTENKNVTDIDANGDLINDQDHDVRCTLSKKLVTDLFKTMKKYLGVDMTCAPGANSPMPELVEFYNALVATDVIIDADIVTNTTIAKVTALQG